MVRKPDKNTPARKASKKRYYIKHRKHDRNRHVRWTEGECRLLLDHSMLDVQLSKMLGRSLQALHVKRAGLMKKKYGVSV